MRKRRVLALLLALSLVVSGNGMTVLAAEQGTDMPVSATEETVDQISAETGEDTSDSADETSETENKEDKSEEKEPDAEGDASAEEGKTDEGETSENPENPGENDPSVPKEDGAEQGEGQPADGEDVKQDETPEESVPETPVEEPVKESEVKEPEKKVFEAAPYVSRIVTFTDDTGMRVTYDANASLQYIYKVENGVLTDVKEKGTGQDVSGNTIEVENPVKFEGNVELKQPEEGETYTSIAASVFQGNQDITYVKLPAGVTSVAAEAFKGCTQLKGVYLPSTVTEIGASAFENCTAMTQISVPKAVVSIGDSAFRGNARLHLVYIKDMDYCELTTIGSGAFEGCATLAEFCSDRGFVLPIKLKSIGESAFKGCKAIKTVDFTDTSLSELGAHAFEGCTGITDLSPGKTLALIPEYAFSGCTALTSINFVNGRNMTIGNYAFSGCIGLKQLTLPQSVIAVRNYAFQNCTRLTRVEIKCYNIEIGDRNEDGDIAEMEAFPGNASGLVIIAEEGSQGYKYARKKGLEPATDAYYKYTVEDVDGSQVESGKFTGGTIQVLADGTDVNTQNGGKGVKSGTECIVSFSQTEEQKNKYDFITGSLRCNGILMEIVDYKYSFKMPEGGAVITAEFRDKTPDKIKGQKVAVEFSAGEPLQNGKQDENGYLGVELKVGQTTRMFLLDEEGESIPVSKLRFTSTSTNIATVSSSGIITAAGTGNAEEAEATIQVVVKGEDGRDITINRTVIVKTSEAKSITLKASNYDDMIDVTGDKYGIQTAMLTKNIVASSDYKITLKANVYDGEDGIGKKLNWTTSDARVASVASATTEAKNPVNVVTIKKGCEGEATITVTANNATGAEKDKVTQKFVVRVYQEGYRLASSSVTVNPNTVNGGTVELISAYGLGLSDATIKLYEETTKASTPFTCEYNAEASSKNCKRFDIKPISSTTIKDKAYKVRVCVNDDTNENNFLPLTVNVKRTVPTPTIKFNTKKVKFNLFYKDGRSTADAEPTVVTTEITKLGITDIRDVKLEPLNKNNADDVLFTENFEIDLAASDLAAGKVIIKRKEGNLQYTSKKQPAVTGYLVIYYDGYSDSAAKWMKVTMPTCTTAPSYALRETKATYRKGCPTQEETLVLYDKKSKTKEQVVLGRDYTVREGLGEIRNIDLEIKDGAIAVSFLPDKGKLRLDLQNADWDWDKDKKPRTLSYNFTVNVSDATPVVKADQNSVSLNVNYPEQTASFRLVSNQRGMEIRDGQTFYPVVTRANELEIKKLDISYENGVGQVWIKDKTVKKGTYKFECNPQADWPGLKKAVLTVKVGNDQPSVKLGKGSLQLNTAVYNRNNSTENEGGIRYQETTERSFIISGRPEGYTLAPVGTGIQNTEIKCTTKGKSGAETHFIFDVREGSADKKGEGILKVSLNDNTLAAGNYAFSMTQRYVKAGKTTVSSKPINFTVKVYYNDEIALTVAAKGKINLVNRNGEPSDKNGIVYTPTLKNLQGKITDVKIYDAVGASDGESKYFDIEVIKEGKDAGKFYVTPKKTVKIPDVPEGSAETEVPVEYEYAALNNNQSYPVYIWAEVQGYAGTPESKNGIYSKTIQIKSAQILPKVTVDKKELNVYLSTKDYDASFVVTPKAGSAGEIEEILFEEKDDKAKESFTLQKELRKDGSIKVTVHLKEGFEYAKDSVNNIKMYVKYKGQGVNTPETATSFTMKIRVN